MGLHDRSSKRVIFIICLFGITYLFLAFANYENYIEDKITDSLRLGILITLCVIIFLLGRTFFHFTGTTPIVLIALFLLIIHHVIGVTEEFEQLRSVPIFGKPSPEKHVMEASLMTGAVCFFLIGIYLSVSKINKARKQLDEHVQILAADRAQLKSLASQLSLTEERERYRLAVELHDHVGQSLVFSKLMLDQFRTSLATVEDGKIIKEISDYLDQAIRDIRTLTFDLSYPVLYELGLEAAVTDWLSERIQDEHGLKTEFEDDGLKKPLDDDVRTTLFRNVRELLTNVLKHARANEVKVSIWRSNGNIHIRVEDDGVGFDPLDAKTRSAMSTKFGLFSVRERLEQLGGIFEIKSTTGRGTKITMTAPLLHD